MYPGQNLISQMLPASRDIRYFQQQQQMQQGGNGGYQSNASYASPNGPDAMGLGPAQDRSGFRDALNNMSPAEKFGLGMAPGIGKVFGLANAVNSGLNMFEARQLAPANQQMSLARQSFQAGEKGGFGGVAQDTNLQGQFNTGQTGLYGDAAAGMGSFGGADVGFGGGFGGGVGTGDFGGSPVDAADMGYAHGGMVKLKDLIQPGPGKDDGYGGLQDGEYVIKKDAVKKYGIKMLENINQRKVSKKQVSNFFKNHG
jgi:hypothetical protein